MSTRAFAYSPTHALILLPRCQWPSPAVSHEGPPRQDQSILAVSAFLCLFLPSPNPVLISQIKSRQASDYPLSGTND